MVEEAAHSQRPGGSREIPSKPEVPGALLLPWFCLGPQPTGQCPPCLEWVSPFQIYAEMCFMNLPDVSQSHEGADRG